MRMNFQRGMQLIRRLLLAGNNMKIKLLIFVVMALTTNLAQAESKKDVIFSKYSSELQLVSYDEKHHVHEFKGTIQMTGTLYVAFDMAEPNQASGYVLFKKFIPDSEYLPLLPTVIDGFYPGKVKYISLNAPQNQIEAFFGGKETFEKISHGNLHEVSKRAEVVLSNFYTSVECDSRLYYAKVTSIQEPTTNSMASKGASPHGC